jgi:hypothetical protein
MSMLRRERGAGRKRHRNQEETKRCQSQPLTQAQTHNRETNINNRLTHPNARETHTVLPPQRYSTHWCNKSALSYEELGVCGVLTGQRMGEVFERLNRVR